MGVWYWKAWIGARFTPATSDVWFDWTTLVAGTTFVPDADKVLNAQMASGATSCSMASTTGLRGKGGLWLGPNGAGQGWEYVEYTSTTATALTGVVREDTATREHNGVHSSGAAVRQWWPVEQNDGKIHLMWQMNEELSARTWTAELSGVKVPRWALRNRHIVVITRRAAVTDPWQIWLVGWLDSPQSDDDGQRLGEWTVQVKSIAGVLATATVPGVRVGEFDTASGGEGKSNTTLAMPWKERLSGDYIQDAPDVTADSVCDGNRSTLWIGERVLGIQEAIPETGDWFSEKGYITTMMLHAPPEWPGLRFIEVHCQNMSGGNGWITDHYNHWYYINAEEEDGSLSGNFVLCEDRGQFIAAFPEAVEKLGGIFTVATWWWNGLNLTENAMAFRWNGAGYLPDWSMPVAWGVDTSVRRANLDLGPGIDTETSEYYPLEKMDPPQPGDVIMFFYTSSSAISGSHVTDSYRYGTLEHIGYELVAMETRELPYIGVKLPKLGLMLRDTITPSVPGVGQRLYLVDGGGPSTGGLESAGTIVVGGEAITYSSKSADSVVVYERGDIDTVALAHAAGDEIQVVSAGWTGKGLPVRLVGWKRQGTANWPKKWYWCTSALENPRFPTKSDEEDDWQADWETLGSVSGNTHYEHTTAPFIVTRRIRWLLMQIEEMTVMPSRPRVNEFIAWLDVAQYDSEGWLAESAPVGDVVERLLERAGVPSASIIMGSAPARTLLSGSTGTGNAWKVIEDVAGYLGLRLRVGLDSRISVLDNSFWRTASLTVVRTWDRSNASALESMWDGGRPANQVAVKYQMNGDIEGIERYPGSAYYVGEPVELGPYLVESTSDAQEQAKKEFFMRRFPYRYMVELEDGDPDRVPGDVEEIEWEFEAGLPAMARTCVAVSVDNVLEAGVWTTVVGLRQATREPHDS